MGCLNKFGRKGNLTRKDLAKARRLFAVHYDLLTIVPLNGAILDAAVDLLMRHADVGISASDSYHLAAFRSVQDRLPQARLILVFSDRPLLSIASRLGFPWFNPEAGKTSELLAIE